MNIFQLLAERVDERFSPGGCVPEWRIHGNLAVLDWDSLGGMHRRGGVLVVEQAPEFVPFTEELKAEGWKRGDAPYSGGAAWQLYAYIRDEQTGAEIRVEALELYGSWPEKNGMIPFFADPPPPPPSSRSGKKKRSEWRGRYEEWERKCRNDEW